jgi:hypothetical protein
MDDNGGSSTSERISILEGAIALARREISVASLEFLAVAATGNAAQGADVRARLVALGMVIDDALEELELLHEELGNTQGSR